LTKSLPKMPQETMLFNPQRENSHLTFWAGSTKSPEEESVNMSRGGPQHFG